MARGYLSTVAEERLDVSGELRVMLKQETVRRVRIDLHLRCGIRPASR